MKKTFSKDPWSDVASSLGSKTASNTNLKGVGGSFYVSSSEEPISNVGAISTPRSERLISRDDNLSKKDKIKDASPKRKGSLSRGTLSKPKLKEEARIDSDSDDGLNPIELAKRKASRKKKLLDAYYRQESDEEQKVVEEVPLNTSVVPRETASTPFVIESNIASLTESVASSVNSRPSPSIDRSSVRRDESSSEQHNAVINGGITFKEFMKDSVYSQEQLNGFGSTGRVLAEVVSDLVESSVKTVIVPHDLSQNGFLRSVRDVSRNGGFNGRATTYYNQIKQKTVTVIPTSSSEPSVRSPSPLPYNRPISPYHNGYGKSTKVTSRTLNAPHTLHSPQRGADFTMGTHELSTSKVPLEKYLSSVTQNEPFRASPVHSGSSTIHITTAPYVEQSVSPAIKRNGNVILSPDFVDRNMRSFRSRSPARRSSIVIINDVPIDGPSRGSNSVPLNAQQYLESEVEGNHPTFPLPMPRHSDSEASSQRVFRSRVDSTENAIYEAEDAAHRAALASLDAAFHSSSHSTHNLRESNLISGSPHASSKSYSVIHSRSSSKVRGADNAYQKSSDRETIPIRNISSSLAFSRSSSPPPAHIVYTPSPTPGDTHNGERWESSTLPIDYSVSDIHQHSTHNDSHGPTCTCFCGRHPVDNAPTVAPVVTDRMQNIELPAPSLPLPFQPEFPEQPAARLIKGDSSSQAAFQPFAPLRMAQLEQNPIMTDENKLFTHAKYALYRSGLNKSDQLTSSTAEGIMNLNDAVGFPFPVSDIDGLATISRVTGEGLRDRSSTLMKSEGNLVGSRVVESAPLPLRAQKSSTTDGFIEDMRKGNANFIHANRSNLGGNSDEDGDKSAVNGTKVPLAAPSDEDIDNIQSADELADENEDSGVNSHDDVITADPNITNQEDVETTVTTTNPDGITTSTTTTTTNIRRRNRRGSLELESQLGTIDDRALALLRRAQKKAQKYHREAVITESRGTYVVGVSNGGAEMSTKSNMNPVATPNILILDEDELDDEKHRDGADEVIERIEKTTSKIVKKGGEVSVTSSRRHSLSSTDAAGTVPNPASNPERTRDTATMKKQVRKGKKAGSSLAGEANDEDHDDDNAEVGEDDDEGTIDRENEVLEEKGGESTNSDDHELSNRNQKSSFTSIAATHMINSSKIDQRPGSCEIADSVGGEEAKKPIIATVEPAERRERLSFTPKSSLTSTKGTSVGSAVGGASLVDMTPASSENSILLQNASKLSKNPLSEGSLRFFTQSANLKNPSNNNSSSLNISSGSTATFFPNVYSKEKSSQNASSSVRTGTNRSYTSTAPNLVPQYVLAPVLPSRAVFSTNTRSTHSDHSRFVDYVDANFAVNHNSTENASTQPTRSISPNHHRVQFIHSGVPHSVLQTSHTQPLDTDQKQYVLHVRTAAPPPLATEPTGFSSFVERYNHARAQREAQSKHLGSGYPHSFAQAAAQVRRGDYKVRGDHLPRETELRARARARSGSPTVPNFSTPHVRSRKSSFQDNHPRTLHSIPSTVLKNSPNGKLDTYVTVPMNPPGFVPDSNYGNRFSEEFVDHIRSQMQPRGRTFASSAVTRSPTTSRSSESIVHLDSKGRSYLVTVPSAPSRGPDRVQPDENRSRSPVAQRARARALSQPKTVDSSSREQSNERDEWVRGLVPEAAEDQANGWMRGLRRAQSPTRQNASGAGHELKSQKKSGISVSYADFMKFSDATDENIPLSDILAKYSTISRKNTADSEWNRKRRTLDSSLNSSLQSSDSVFVPITAQAALQRAYPNSYMSNALESKKMSPQKVPEQSILAASAAKSAVRSAERAALIAQNASIEASNISALRDSTFSASTRRRSPYPHH